MQGYTLTTFPDVSVRGGAGRRGFSPGLSFHWGTHGPACRGFRSVSLSLYDRKPLVSWSWKILLDFIAMWLSIPCQVFSHMPAIPKLGISPLGYAT